jgi:two-component system, NtrC family, response regulator HydG
MKAEDLRLQELVDFEEGNLTLYGRRLILHSIHAFAQFRKDILDMLGAEHARRIFTRFGFFWGQADAAAMKRILEWKDHTELLRAGGRLHTLEGAAQVSFDKLKCDKKAGKLYMEVTWKDSGEAEEHLREVGWSDSPICWKLVGYASGYSTFCMGKPVYFIEKKCRAKGDDVCTAVGKDIDSWGDEIKSHLQYFEAEDIKGEVIKLTEQLHEKMKDLEKRRRTFSRLQRTMTPFFLEFRSNALKKTLDLADRIAQFDSSVLITGETGVGKEVLAHYIHNKSHRSNGPFVAINCGALPETLLESELFGHKAGSFTGAIRDRVGLFEQANKGTVFLDEIGDISPAMQLNILRVLQEKEVTRIGESISRKIDSRIISATNKRLEDSVAKGNFREDLLYRLRVIELEIPPLRERQEDIIPLARYIVSKFSKRLKIPDLRLDATSLDYLLAYSWPGNIREMENIIERAAILSKDGLIRPEYLPPNMIRDTRIFAKIGDQVPQTLEQMEKRYIDFVLKSTAGNKAQASKILGISTSTLWRKLQQT